MAIAGWAPRRCTTPTTCCCCCGRGKFAAHWFETGTPAFLVDTLFERRVASVSLDRTVSTTELLSAFDVGGRTAAEHIGTEALLFQTGYLTITGEEELGGRTLYRLGYPNREVRQSLNEHLLQQLVQDVQQQIANSMRPGASACRARLRRPEGAVPGVLREHPVRVVHEQRHRELRGLLRERVLLLLRGARVPDCGRGESSSHGRLDMAVRTGGHVYLFEFKVVEMAPPGSALAQLQERDYAAKYRGRGEPIHLIGVEFSRQTRNVTAFEVADG